MKQLPVVKESFRTVFDMCRWPVREKVLAAGIELGIFDAISAPASAENVARSIGTHPGNTGLLLDALAALDLVVKRNGLYRNAPVSQAFLIETSPTFLGAIFTYLLTSAAFTSEELMRWVREGSGSSTKAHTASDEMTKAEVTSYISFQRAGRAQKVASVVSALLELPSFYKMLDLGCGPGINGIAIVSGHPTMRGVSFDRPRTVNVARRSIREYGMEDRMTAIGGDHTCDPIGEDYDLILACDTLCYSEDEIDHVMSKIHAALSPQGVLLSIHHGLTHERTKPAGMVLGMLISGLKGEDMEVLDQGFIADAMIRAGFRSVRSRTLDSDWGELDADIARK